MSHIDDILAHLDHATQRPGDAAYPSGHTAPEVCWRCDATQATTDVGLCDECAEVMRSERAPEPPVESSWQEVALSILHRGLVVTFPSSWSDEDDAEVLGSEDAVVEWAPMGTDEWAPLGVIDGQRSYAFTVVFPFTLGDDAEEVRIADDASCGDVGWTAEQREQLREMGWIEL